MIGRYTAIGIAGLLCSCASYTPKDVVQPSDIKIQTAMVDTAQGLIKMRDTLKGQYKTGLFPDQAQITFNVTAGATDKQSLSLDVGTKTPGPTVVSGDAKYGYEASSTAGRGNQIVVTFKNIMTADLNDVGLYQQGLLRTGGKTPKRAGGDKTNGNDKTSTNNKPPTNTSDSGGGVTPIPIKCPPQCIQTMSRKLDPQEFNFLQDLLKNQKPIQKVQ